MSASTRKVTVGSRVRRLVWLMLIPTSAISVIAALAVYRSERESVVEAALETARALSQVADRELALRAAVLQTLARSHALKTGDLKTFYDEATSAAPSAENAIVLTALDGQQVLNTRVPFERSSGLPHASVPALAEGQAVQYSDLYMAPLGKSMSFAVRVPVYVDGQLRYTLGMGSVAAQMQKIFKQQPLPPTWLGVVLDGQARVVARTLDPEKRVGQQASDKMREAMQRANSGVVSVQTLDAVPVFTAFAKAPESGWHVLVSLQREELRGGALRAFGLMMLASLASIGLTLLIALRIGRSIVAPLQRLRSDAEVIGQGGQVAESQSGLVEIDAVQALLAQASSDRARTDERLRDEVASALAKAEVASEAVLKGQKLEALGRLTGGIAHDFNNLLQTMSTGLDIATRLNTDPRAKNALAACQRAAQNAVKLTRQLMTFGRAQAGSIDVLQLDEALPAYRELIQGAMRETVKLDMSALAGVWPVRVDAVQLELALLNLALNARDAMAGKGSLTVSVGNRHLAPGEVGALPAGDYVAISVRDTGAGMPPEVLQRAFEPFFTTKDVGKGSGLGLAQVYGFAQRSGGTATLASQPGNGTEVTLWLPRSDAAANAPIEPAALTAPLARQATLLLVEDDAGVRDITVQALQELGFTVISATNADEALEIVRTRVDIDVVLSDVVMPGERGGIELVRILKVLRPALPVALASGYAEQFDADLDVPLIQKPYDVAKVARQLVAMLDAKGSDFGKL